jgi:hypothetical protein
VKLLFDVVSGKPECVQVGESQPPAYFVFNGGVEWEARYESRPVAKVCSARLSNVVQSVTWFPNTLITQQIIDIFISHQVLFLPNDIAVIDPSPFFSIDQQPTLFNICHLQLLTSLITI